MPEVHQIEGCGKGFTVLHMYKPFLQQLLGKKSQDLHELYNCQYHVIQKVIVVSQKLELPCKSGKPGACPNVPSISSAQA